MFQADFRAVVVPTYNAIGAEVVFLDDYGNRRLKSDLRLLTYPYQNELEPKLGLGTLRLRCGLVVRTGKLMAVGVSMTQVKGKLAYSSKTTVYTWL